MADSPKDFLLQHMTASERERGITPHTRRNDDLAQGILADVESRPAPRRERRRLSGEPGIEKSPHVDGVEVKTYSREETDALRKKQRERFYRLFENQELFLKYRAVSHLRQFPECQPLFDRLNYWKTTYLFQAKDKDAAQLTGDAEAAKVIDEMLAEYEKRTGRPWYFIRKGDEYVNPGEVIKQHPACK